MEEYNKFASDLAIVGVAKILVKLRGLLLIPIIVKILSTADYGSWANLMVTIEFIVPVTSVGLILAMHRFIKNEPIYQKRESFYSIFLLSSIFSFIVCFFLFLYSKYFASFILGNPLAINIARYGSILAFFWCTSNFVLEFFRSHRHMGTYISLQLFQSFSEITLCIIFLFNGFHLLGVVLSFLIIRFLSTVISLGLIYRLIGFKIPNFSGVKKYVLFGLPMVPGTTGMWITKLSDRYMISFFLGASSVGVYHASAVLGMSSVIVTEQIKSVFLPTVCDLWQRNKKKELKNCFRYSLKYLYFLAIPTSFILIVLGKDILSILSSEELAESGYLVTSIISISLIALGVFSINNKIFLLMNKTKYIAYLWFSAAIMNIIQNIILIPIFGIIGAAFSTLTSYLFISSVATIMLHRVLGVSIEPIALIRTTFSSIVMVLFIFFFKGSSLLAILLSIVSGLLFYLFILILVRFFEKKEINFIKHIIYSKIRFLFS